MKREYLFYRCNHCGNIVSMVERKGGVLVCCGEAMTLLTANTTDAAQEKHVPVAVRVGEKINVTVGSVLHPMVPEHYIQWIAVVGDDYTQMVYLKAGDAPAAEFVVPQGAATVYAYCNLHGLWAAEV